MELLYQLGMLLLFGGLAILFFGTCWLLWRSALEASRAERALLLAGALGVIAVCLVPASLGGYRGAMPMYIFITASWVAWAARGLAVAGFGALAASSKRHGRRRGLQGGLLAILVIVPAAECGRFASDLAPWHSYSTLDHPTGTRYAFVESSFLQGQLLAIARVEAERWYGTEYTALVLTNGDSPRAFVSLMRPDTEDAAAYGRLHLAPDGRVIAVRSINHAYMALDPVTGQQWSHEAIYDLSPFVLLDAQARPSANDVALTKQRIGGVCVNHAQDRDWLGDALERGSISGIPSVRGLRAAAAQHTNPAARTVAQELLTSLQEQPCFATAPAPSQN